MAKRKPGELVVYAGNSKSGSVFEITTVKEPSF